MAVPRSAAWFGGDDEVAMLNRVALGDPGLEAGLPVVGIADTTSDLNPCHAAFATVLPELERGIRDGGAIPARFPVMSLGEDLMKPAAMLYRNMVAMELEENLRAYPLDAVVYLANCDKTVPAALMAAASVDVPGLLLLGGSRRAPEFRGVPLGSGTALWRALDERRGGHMDDAAWRGLETTLACAGAGSCNTMGTATTMALMAETLGLALPGAAGRVVGSPELLQLAYDTGVEVARRARAGAPAGRDQMTVASFEAAYRVLAAIGGSTNAVIHLAAVAGRLGIETPLERIDGWWRDIPLVTDVEPTGHHLAHDFADAGGLATLGRSLIEGGLINPDIVLADGDTLAQHAARAPEPTTDGVIRVASAPVAQGPTLVAVHGTLAPLGAVIKVASATPELLEHEGAALVFDDYETMRRRLDDPELEADENTVLVMRGAGPVGVPGMPEWGMVPVPAALAARGVTDMVRVTDSRMSGTSFGTVVLHCAPESAVGGPLALVQDGDRIRLDVAARRIDVLVPADEWERRREAWRPPVNEHVRGWPRLYRDHVQQAPDGCDLDFLRPVPGTDGTWRHPVVGRS